MPYVASFDFIIIWHYKIGSNIFLTLLIDFIIVLFFFSFFSFFFGNRILDLIYVFMFTMPIVQVNCLSLLQNEPYCLSLSNTLHLFTHLYIGVICVKVNDEIITSYPYPRYMVNVSHLLLPFLN
jgi:hypothetical protein